MGNQRLKLLIPRCGSLVVGHMVNFYSFYLSHTRYGRVEVARLTDHSFSVLMRAIAFHDEFDMLVDRHLPD